MKLRLLAIGQRAPAWVQAGFDEFATRLPRELKLELVELPLGSKSRGADVARAQALEGEKLLDRSAGSHRVVLDERGSAWTSQVLSENLGQWMQAGRDVAFLVGGPDGHADPVRNSADQRWSLSRLTLPHALVRVVLAEQIYRAWTLLNNHPYHRS